MKTSLAVTVLGAILVFAYRGHETTYANVSIRAAGWVFLLTGAFFGVLISLHSWHRGRVTIHEEE